MIDWPKVHPALKRQFSLPGTTPIRLYPVNLDVKQTEFARCLFIDNHRSALSDDAAGSLPVLLSTDPHFESLFCQAKPPVCIILDFHDKGRQFDFLGLTEGMWQTIAEHQLKVVYVKLQIHEPAKYRELNRLPRLVHVLSCPMLMGGSRFHITVQADFEGDAIFSRVLSANPSPTYEYDWSFVGSPTSDDRAAAFEVLRPYESRRRFFTVSQPGHADASVATVPQAEYLHISRTSKVCLSLNGRGPWCLKDGELLASNCLVLRQWHPMLTLNPLTPRDGEHWAVAKTENLVETVEGLLHDVDRSENIRRQGHQMFRDVLLSHRWAKVYVSALSEFLKIKDKSAWNQLCVA